MAGHIFINEDNHTLETVRNCISRLGGPNIVTAIRLCTQPSHIPYPIALSEHWPLVIEVSPLLQQYAHVGEIRVQNLRIGISAPEELYIPLPDEDLQIDKFLKSIGFDIQELYCKTFKGERFVPDKVSS